MKKLVAVLTILAFTEASAYTGTWNDPLRPFDATKNYWKEVKIEWIVVDNVQRACNKESSRMGFAPVGPATACAFWSGQTCKIITSKTPTMHELGHEVRHCFQGHWH